MLEGLDVLVLRGSPEDVAQVQKIIEQVEKLARETEPEIKIFPLQYVDCTAISTMVVNLYIEVYQSRQGAVSITPIVKPNAILIVGRPENVKTVVDLVEKLDQPMDPTAQIQFFHLRYAQPAAVGQAISDLYPGDQGLSPPVRITVDTRSNAVIVQASPRDMTAIATLIKGIDISKPDGDKGAVNEVRIVQLQHSMAYDIANVLMQAISAATGQLQTGMPGMQQQGMGGFPGQGAQARPGMQGRPQGSQRMLSFLAGQKLISSGILTDVSVTPDTRSNSVMVSAPKESMELLLALIKQLDELPAAEAQIKVFTIYNGDATTLMTTLQQLFVSQMGGGGQMQMQMQMQNQAGTSTVPLRFAADTRTNSIIASGASGDLAVVEAVLARLDDEVRNRKSVVFRLKNSPAANVANTITTFLSSERTLQQQIDRG